MKPILVVENDTMLAGPGWITRVLDRRGLPHRVVDATTGGLDGIDAGQISGLITLGGRGHAWDEDAMPWLAQERILTQQCVAGDVPVLGCCLGGQILARALGGTVREHAQGEYGWLDISPVGEGVRDPLFSLAGAADPVYLWHLDEFTLPPGSVHLATSQLTEVQGSAHGRSWGLQFHPEWTCRCTTPGTRRSPMPARRSASTPRRCGRRRSTGSAIRRCSRCCCWTRSRPSCSRSACMRPISGVCPCASRR